jgi:excisionase family DNA binding protein
VDRWLSTGEAADLLGTSTTTVRAMASRGELVHQVTRGRRRQKWMISRESAQSWLAAHGRIDDRRHRRWPASIQDDDARQQLANMTQLYQHMQADRDRLSNEVAALRTLAMQLRIRNAAVSEAESHQAQAARLWLEAAQAQARAADALRRGITAQDDALGQFLVPGPFNDE